MSHKTEIRIFRNASALRTDMTDAELVLWQALRAHQMGGIHFRRQHPIGHYIVDFCSHAGKLVIEVDGGQHLENEDYDRRRSEFLQSRGYRVLRFWDHEVLTELDAVLQVIFEAVREER